MNLYPTQKISEKLGIMTGFFFFVACFFIKRLTAKKESMAEVIAVDKKIKVKISINKNISEVIRQQKINRLYELLSEKKKTP